MLQSSNGPQPAATQHIFYRDEQLRFIIRVLSGLLLLTAVGEVFAQNISSNISTDPRREWFDLAQGRTDFEVSDPALVPRQLAIAARQENCQYEDGIKRNVIRFIKVKSRRIVIVPCVAVYGSDMAFDLSNLNDPVAMQFPVLAQPEGFRATNKPGAMTWNKDTGIVQVERSASDMMPSMTLRYTYLIDGSPPGSPLVVKRVEAR
jgi:hypothetical protein